MEMLEAKLCPLNGGRSKPENGKTISETGQSQC